MQINQVFLTVLAAGISTGISLSETIVADETDASARSNGGSGQNTNNVLFAGSYYADCPGITPIFSFLLPDPGEGDPSATVTLTLELQSFLRRHSFTQSVVKGDAGRPSLLYRLMPTGLDS